MTNKTVTMSRELAERLLQRVKEDWKTIECEFGSIGYTLEIALASGDEPEIYALIEALTNPSAEPTLIEHCKKCAEVVKTWSESKRDCLGKVEPVVERQAASAWRTGSIIWSYEADALRHSDQHGVKVIPLYTAPLTLAELQATIARLETQLNNAINLDFERRAEIERLKVEPVATLWELVIPDEPGNPESPCEYVYTNSMAGRDLLLLRDGTEVFAEYACIDKVKELNNLK